MHQTLRSLYESQLGALQQLATKRSRLNARRYNETHKRETGESLSSAQFRQLSDDIAQDALADHWERFSQWFGIVDGYADPGTIERARQWLETSRLRFRRSANIVGAGLSHSIPELPCTDSVQRLASGELRQWLAYRNAGLSHRSICESMFGIGGKQWKAYRQLVVRIQNELSLIAQLSRSVEPFQAATDTLDAIQTAIVDCENELSDHLPVVAPIEPDSAYDLAQWYASQSSPAYARQVNALNAYSHDMAQL